MMSKEGVNLQRHGYLLILFFLVILPTDRYFAIGAISLVDIIILAALVLVTIDSIQSEFQFTTYSLLALGIFTLIAILRVPPLFSTANPINSLKFLFTGIVVIGLHVVMVRFLTRHSDFDLAIRIIVLSAVVINMGNILQAYELVTLPFSRFSDEVRTIGAVQLPVARRGTFMFLIFGTYGIWSTIALSFAMVSAVVPKPLSRRTSILSAIIIFYGSIFVVQSRNVWAGITLAILVVSVCLSYRYKPVSRRYLKAGFVGVIVSIPITVPRIFRRLVAISPSSFESRIQQYEIAFDLLIAHPISGVGRGTIEHVTNQALHSFYVQMMVFNTWLGLPIFLVLVGLLLRFYLPAALSRDYHANAIGFLGAFTGTLVILATYPGTSTYVTWLLFSWMSIYAGYAKVSPTSGFEQESKSQ